MCKKLPVDQPEFIALLEREKIIDEEAKKKMNSKRSKDIRADVVVEEIEKSLLVGNKLDKLLEVMKEYGQGLEILAQEIENNLDPSTYVCLFICIQYLCICKLHMYVCVKYAFSIVNEIIYIYLHLCIYVRT